MKLSAQWIRTIFPASKAEFKNSEDFYKKVTAAMSSYNFNNVTPELESLINTLYELDNKKYEKIIKSYNIRIDAFRDNALYIDNIIKTVDEPMDILKQLLNIYMIRCSVIGRNVSDALNGHETKLSIKQAANTLISSDVNIESSRVSMCQKDFNERIKNLEIDPFLINYVDEISSSISFQQALNPYTRIRENNRLMQAECEEKRSEMAAKTKTILMRLKKEKRANR